MPGADGRLIAPVPPRTTYSCDMAEGSRLNGGRTWRTWQLLVAAVVALLMGIGIGAAGQEDDDQTVRAAGDQATTVNPPLVTTAPTTPTSPPTTLAPTTTVATTTTAPPQPRDIATFTGSSTKTTENFAVRNPWRLRWRITGGAGVGIEIYDASGTRLEFLTTDPGQDETVVRRACTCYLKIEPFGSSYSITVNGLPA